MKVQCKVCGTPIDFADVRPEVLESPEVSVIVVEHRKPGFCLNCKAPVALTVANMNMTIMAMPVRREQRSPIVLAPAGALPKVRG
jgi:hypothetical protein